MNFRMSHASCRKKVFASAAHFARLTILRKKGIRLKIDGFFIDT